MALKLNRGRTETGRSCHQAGKEGRGQTGIEYLLVISAAIVFVSIVAYVVKNSVLR